MKSIKIFHKRIALFLVVIFLNQAFFPAFAMALTSGPTQPEVVGFQPIGTTGMVDLFTGNFNYNIPLCDIGGYPLNLSYQADPKMDDEASWVGLGWSLNPGVINREMRGLPDDFNGEEIEKEYNIKSNWTLGVASGKKLEAFGLLGVERKRGIFYNNYQGFGFERSVSPYLSIGKKNDNVGAQLGLGLSLGYSTGAGISISPFANIEGASDKIDAGIRANTNINSRNGLKQLTLTSSLSYREEISIGMRNGGSFNFGPYSYIPTARLPLKNDSKAFSASLGGAAFGVHGAASLTGYYSKQQLAANKQDQSSFGYLYLQNGNDAENVVQDYNVQPGLLRQDMPDLPLAYGTNDIYAVQAQGMGGQYRAIRNDVGVFRPALHSNIGQNLSLGAEIGVGNTVHVGADGEDIISGVSAVLEFVDVNAASSYSSNSGWKEYNFSLPKMPFTSSDQLYEHAFFKSMGEKVATDESYWAQIGGQTPFRNEIDKLGSSVIAPAVLENGTEELVLPNTLQRANEREIRNQVFSYLTIDEREACLDEKIHNYPFPDVNGSFYPAFSDCEPSAINGQVEEIERDDIAGAGKDQITEITVTQPDGSRYVYGIPVYNKVQKEVTFSVADKEYNTIYPSSPNSGDLQSYGLVSYDTEDATINNDKGRDHYFESTKLPPYAHSYLLTAVLPPDYADRKGDGITDDDNGSAVKFNYSKTSYDYNWRTPIQANKAQYHPGRLVDPTDDKASYVYGERELWYLHSVESRTMVAQFYTSEREDALGVLGEHGGVDSNAPSRRLDSIRVFSKSELTTNFDNAVPIKTIHFEYYDYNESLCKGAPNHVSNNGGKLTLKHVYFTYGNSQRGRLNAYHFAYNNDDANQPINYSTGTLDRWGGVQIPSNSSNSYPFPHEFPYTIQDQSAVEMYRGAWNLKQITTPSGGEISVEYEPDDYAYVQDKRAGQMFKIEGFADDLNDTPGPNLYDNAGPMQFMVVKSTEDLTGLSNQEKINRYFEDVESLYFKCLVKLTGNDSDDLISGYAEFDRSGIDFVPASGGSENIYIPINEISVKADLQTHPISQAAFQTMRLEIPALIYPDQDFEEQNNVVESVFNGFETMAREVQFLLKGFERKALQENWAKTIDPTRSWVRLANPNYKKYGGSTRVSQISLSDKWNFGGGESVYGQKYSYTKEENGQTISSGVACYEPLIGGEENLMRNPMPYDENIPLAPDNYYYTEKPIGEILYPAPVIGYSKVKVESLDYPNVDRTGTGHVIHEFFTAKEFPVIVQHTNVDKERSKSNPLLKFFKISTHDQLGLTQGFSIEINDMHGKPKSVQSYDIHDLPISSTEYFYKLTEESEDGKTKVLDNDVLVINKNNEIRTASVGVDIEMWQEMSEDYSRTSGVGLAVNTEGFFAAIIPVLLLIPLRVSRDDFTRVNKSVTTKLIRQCGLLEKVVVTENGSSMATENILYDEATGNVLLTRTENEFGDPMYNLTYPAHWVEEFEGMSHAYHNIGAIFNEVTIDNGVITDGLPNAEDFFFPGDEVLVREAGNGNTYYAWVVEMRNSDISTYNCFFDKNGQRIQPNGEVTLKIVRSGRRNQPSAPIASYEMLKNPLNSSETSIEMNVDKSYLSGSAVEYCENWQMNCSELESTPMNDLFVTNETINPYIENVLGNWRATENLIFRGAGTPTSRSESSLMTGNGAANIRDNGYLNGFANYWEYNTGKWSVNNANLWQMSQKRNVIDTKGRVIESKDALDVLSSAIVGYNDNLVTAQAVNASSKDIAFDNFEDYNFDTDCTDDEDRRRLDFYHIPSSTAEQIGTSSEYAHTGKFSAYTATNSIQADALTISCITGRTPDNCEVINGGEEVKNRCCHCLPQLELSNGHYHVSMWVANEGSLKFGTPVVDPDPNIDNEITFKVEFLHQNFPIATMEFSPSGPVIEGWQRIEGDFVVDGSTQAVKFYVESAVSGIYMDDFRIHPFRSNMQSYVYDPFSLRLMASLDENNYATFYEYDDEGLLVRVKRETDQGVATIQEARTVLKPSVIQPTPPLMSTEME
ncbi:MAG: hypothetical protein MI974_29155 [Chitinophagales bacterium]|nr:hypothetical protein [Chitinophagales bacterium]